ncbi:MAG: ABC transporter ATP-binding protein, partial [Longicatena sp.]
MIKVRSLTKNFAESVVLSDVNLEIKEGSIYGLIGPNGAGKSTLLKIMAGIIKPEIGNVLIDNEVVFDNPEAKKEIMLLSDDPFFFMNATIKDMKDFYQAWYPSFDEDAYNRYIQTFRLNEKKQMKNFSKGMKRQAFIAIALAIRPKYLYLDEAFDGLDPMMRLIFKRAVAELLEDSNITIIISSHNLRELEDICDTFGILENGQINTSGYIDEAKENLHKIQLAFKEEVKKEDFSELDLLSIQIQSRVVNIVVRGNIEKIS